VVASGCKLEKEGKEEDAMPKGLDASRRHWMEVPYVSASRFDILGSLEWKHA